MLRRLVGVVALAVVVLATVAWRHPGAPLEESRIEPRLPATPAKPSIAWRHSRPLGLPWAGRLHGGVRLPAGGPTFFTWDPVRKRAPNRGWRRFGSARLVETVLRVLDDFAAAHPEAPRIGIGDLSRPRGGDFGPRYGLPGHVSHQNGLDVDVYFPRRDGRERPPARPEQIDRRLAQDLVDRFVRAGASKVFIGPRTRLTGPPSVVQILAHHDNHLHVRLPLRGLAGDTLGRSALGRRIALYRFGDPRAETRILVVGCIHGTECAGLAVTRRLVRARAPSNAAFAIVPNLNPDGLARRTRQNARGVDLNRNFASEWRPLGRRWDLEYSGPKPWSEPETRLARNLIRSFRPTVTIWFHQPQRLVRAWGGSRRVARHYAHLARERFRALPWPNGSAPNWQNHHFPGTSAFVVELPAGELSARDATRHARAVLGLARAFPK